MTQETQRITKKTEGCYDIGLFGAKIEFYIQFYQDTKKLTRLAGYQYRLANIFRNHIGCARLNWFDLTQVAQGTIQSRFQVKHEVEVDYKR